MTEEVTSVLRFALLEDWLEAQLGPALSAYASTNARERRSALLDRVLEGEDVISHDAIQAALTALACATRAEERVSALNAVSECAPATVPSASDRARALEAVLGNILNDIMQAPTAKQAEALARSAQTPLTSLIKLLVEGELSWPTEPRLAQALWDSDREFPVWELVSHLRG